jgi:hypothetical protein
VLGLKGRGQYRKRCMHMRTVESDRLRNVRSETPCQDAEPPAPPANVFRNDSSGMAFPRPTPRIIAARTRGPSRRSPQLSDLNSSAQALQG